MFSLFVSVHADTHFKFDSLKVRCVINLKGVTCFEKLQNQLSVYIRAARGMPFDPTMTEELPVSTKIGPFDPSTVSHQTLSDTIVGMENDPYMMEYFDPPKSILDLVSLKCSHCEMENIGSINISTGHELPSISPTLDTKQFGFDEGFFGDIVVDGTLSKTIDVCVYRGKLKTSSEGDEKYALKLFLQKELHPSKFHDVICEAKIGMGLEHENICRYIDAIHTQT